MAPWILFSIAAALVQTLRFMVQRQLKTAGLSTGGATLARFLYGAPIALVFVVLYGVTQGGWPGVMPGFWAYALVGGTAQILATLCVVAIFGMRNFAVGMTLKKTEVMMTALAGIVILGESVVPLGWVALGIGFFGVLLLSDPPEAEGPWTSRVLNKAAGLGVLSGVFFAVSAVGYRGATLAVESDDPLMRAALTLAFVTFAQATGLGAWLALRETGEVRRTLKAWRVAGLAGVFGAIGSFCWFTAFTLQNAAYVFAVGQIELIFSLIASVLFFRERVNGRELGGMALLTISILALVLFL